MTDDRGSCTSPWELDLRRSGGGRRDGADGRPGLVVVVIVLGVAAALLTLLWIVDCDANAMDQAADIPRTAAD